MEALRWPPRCSATIRTFDIGISSVYDVPAGTFVPDGRAARACAQVAQQLGHAEAVPLLYELAEDPPPPPVEVLRATSLLNRVGAYTDRLR